MAGLATATAVVLLDALRNGLDLALLTVSTAELETPHLKSHDAVAQLDQVNEAVEVLRRQNVAIALSERKANDATDRFAV